MKVQSPPANNDDDSEKYDYSSSSGPSSDGAASPTKQIANVRHGHTSPHGSSSTSDRDDDLRIPSSPARAYEFLGKFLNHFKTLPSQIWDPSNQSGCALDGSDSEQKMYSTIDDDDNGYMEAVPTDPVESRLNPEVPEFVPTFAIVAANQCQTIQDQLVVQQQSMETEMMNIKHHVHVVMTPMLLQCVQNLWTYHQNQQQQLLQPDIAQPQNNKETEAETETPIVRNQEDDDDAKLPPCITPQLCHPQVRLSYKVESDDEHYLEVHCGTMQAAVEIDDIDKSVDSYMNEIVECLFWKFHVKLHKPWRWLNLRSANAIKSLSKNEEYVLEEAIKIGVKHGKQPVEYMDYFPNQSFADLFVKYARRAPSDVTFYLEHNPFNLYGKHYLNATPKQIGVNHGTVICVDNVDIVERNMKVFVRTLSGGSIAVKVHPLYYVIDLKYLLYTENKNIGVTPEPAMQTLIYGGKRLEDCVTLHSCAIEKEDVLFLVLNLRGS